MFVLNVHWIIHADYCFRSIHEHELEMVGRYSDFFFTFCIEIGLTTTPGGCEVSKVFSDRFKMQIFDKK